MYLMLGLLQGATEFLPVSSSGHLVLGQRLFGVTSPGVVLEVALHVATTGAVLVFFRRRLADIFKRAAGSAGWLRFISLIAVASVPAAVVGLFFEDEATALFESPKAVAWGLVFTGLVLLTTFIIRRRGRNLSDLSYAGAFLVGVAQAVAVAPGISRSGMTVVAGVAVGLAGAEAAAFSFLLSVPAVLGAAALETRHLVGGDFYWPGVAVGVIAAFFSGLVAIYIVVSAARSRHFGWFGVYCVLAGILAGTFIR